MVEILKLHQQVYGEFNNGEIKENKPIGFPHEIGGIKAYSNLFYWAHANSTTDSTIGLHPHKGFEIMSYVIKGSIKHYDTLIKKWINLNQGDVQIIQSGSGISHSEAIEKNASIFQIWFDPNLKIHLKSKASYKDYSSKIFKSDGIRKNIIGKNSPVNLKAEKIEVFELNLFEDYIIKNIINNYLSIYVLSGSLQLNEDNVRKNDFIKIYNEKNIKVKIQSSCKLFCVSSPLNVSYETYK